MTMRVASLSSGSSGNSYYIEGPDGAVVIDAGLSGKALVERLIMAGGDPAKVRGVIVTHDHRDHSASAGILQRRHGWKLWMTRGTRDTSPNLGKVEVEIVAAGSGLMAAGMTFHFLATTHDGAEPIVVTAEHGGLRCGVFTDLGRPSQTLAAALDSLDFVFLESNYDPDLLAKCDYPPSIKARIRGDGGHISNAEAAGLVAGLPGGRLRSVVLSHLSENSNRPDLAYADFIAGLGDRRREQGLRVGVAKRHLPMPLCAIDGTL